MGPHARVAPQTDVQPEPPNLWSNHAGHRSRSRAAHGGVRSSTSWVTPAQRRAPSTRFLTPSEALCARPLCPYLISRQTLPFEWCLSLNIKMK